MNTQEFEAELSKRGVVLILPPQIVDLAISQNDRVLYLDPTAWLTVFDSLGMDKLAFKKSESVGTFSYYSLGLKGVLKCKVSYLSMQTLSGDKMDIATQLKTFFDAHITMRKAAKAFILGVFGLVATIGLASVGALDGSNFAYAIPILTAVFTALQNWVSNNPTLPIVGAGVKKA